MSDNPAYDDAAARTLIGCLGAIWAFILANIGLMLACAMGCLVAVVVLIMTVGHLLMPPTPELRITRVDAYTTEHMGGISVEVEVRAKTITEMPLGAPAMRMMTRCFTDGDTTSGRTSELFFSSLNNAPADKEVQDVARPFFASPLARQPDRCDLAFDFEPWKTLRRYCWEADTGEVREGTCQPEEAASD